MNNNEEKILEKEIKALKEETEVIELLDRDVNLAAHQLGDKISKNTWVIAVSILLAGAFIGGGLFFSGGYGAPSPAGNNSPENVSKIVKSDHIKGSVSAPVKIIEFSDMECPYCKTFHETMNRVMVEYGAEGKVAWIYRHFPLTNIHPSAILEAQASECAAELGGNDKFWAYIDRVFEITPSNNGLSTAQLPQIAAFVGLDVAKFNECLAADKYKDKISDHSQDAVNSGAQGTPYSVVITRRGEKLAINGALPYESVKQIIEQALK